MILAIPKGTTLLRLTAVTPLNAGSSSGGATLDRPLARDAWTGLPYLPFSSLKGVLAGRYGNVIDHTGSLNIERTGRFGAPDSAAGAGRPGAFEVGDGELLTFPVRSRGGVLLHVAPLSTLRRLRSLGLLPLEEALPQLGAPTDVLARCSPAALPAEVSAGSHPALGSILSGLAGKLGLEGDGSTLVLAREEAARRLFIAAAEVRTLTALANSAKLVTSGSLRQVELLPPESVLVSIVTAARQVSLARAACLQVGAWESWGCGFLRAEVGWARGTRPASSSQSAAQGVVSPRPDAEVMVLAFSVWAKVPENKRPPLRPLIRETGPRLKRLGLSATLAFSLAKAALAADNPTSGAKPHRWLLQALLGRELDLSRADHRRSLMERAEAVIQGSLAAPDVLAWCRWLARFAEGRT